MLGAFISLLSILGILYAVVLRILTNNWVEGWTMLFISILAFGGANLLSIGIVGEYVGRIYKQVKGRPIFIISEDTRDQRLIQQKILRNTQFLSWVRAYLLFYENDFKKIRLEFDLVFNVYIQRQVDFFVFLFIGYFIRSIRWKFLCQTSDLNISSIQSINNLFKVHV